MTSSRLVAPELTTIEVHGHTREAFLLRATLAAGATYGECGAQKERLARVSVNLDGGHLRSHQSR